MGTPLKKRLPRELRGNVGKYIGIFALIVIVISFGAGFLGSIEALRKTNLEIPETYALEDGRFTVSFRASDAALDAVRNLGVEVYENFSYDLPISGGSAGEGTVRVHKVRDDVDLACYIEGNEPTADDEIALSQRYCVNNDLAVGDTVEIGGRQMEICATITLPDYISPFQKNSDLLFNAVTFCVAEVSDTGYDAFAGEQETFTYSFVFDDDALTAAERNDLEEDMADALEDAGAVLTDFIDVDDNQGVNYASGDLDGDFVMMMGLLVLVIIIVAFVFAVLTSSTISEEAAIIGTLLASGYRKREIVGHYLAEPTIVGLIAAVVGNAIGYAFMVDFVTDIYTSSYSYPPIEPVFSVNGLLLTTIVPLAMLVGIMAVALLWKMRRRPLQFLRHELSGKKVKGGMRLPARWGFAHRFRTRVILRNIPNYLVLAFGMLFASLLFLFGAGLLPSIENYGDELVADMPAAHRYVLKTPVELDGTEQQREDYAALVELTNREDADDIDFDEVADLIDTSSLSTSELSRLSEISDELEDADAESVSGDLLDEVLDFVDEDSLDADEADLYRHARLIAAAADIDEDANMVNTKENSAAAIEQAEKFATQTAQVLRPSDGEMEDVSVYGVEEDSRYYEGMDVTGGAVVVGRGFSEKFGVKVGDEFTLYDKYSDKTYAFVASATFGNASNTDVYMSLATFNETFDHDADYFAGYLSDEELAIEGTWLATDIDSSSLTGFVEQMSETFSGMMYLFNAFAVIIYFVLMYLLTKTIIEHGARYISYLKVFGYTDREVSRLYVRSITVATIVFLVISIPLGGWLAEAYCNLIFQSYSGHIVMAFPQVAYVATFVAGVACYAVVSFLHVRRIKRVPLALAMKVQD